MEVIKIAVTGNIAKVTEKPLRITSGTVGLPVEFTFDSQWDSLNKIAVFKAGAVSKYMVLEDDATVVPMEVMAKPNVRLNIGVYGVEEDGSPALPTIWANAGLIRDGAVPGDSAGSDIGLAQKYYNKGELAAEEADASAKKAEDAADRAEAAADRAEAAGGGGGSVSNAVLYTPQTLTKEQQAQARENIGAVSDDALAEQIDGIMEVFENYVSHHAPQNLSKEQQAQARENIGAISNDEMVAALNDAGIRQVGYEPIAEDVVTVYASKYYYEGELRSSSVWMAVLVPVSPLEKYKITATYGATPKGCYFISDINDISSYVSHITSSDPLEEKTLEVTIPANVTGMFINNRGDSDWSIQKFNEEGFGVAQVTGDSETCVMSQKATTDAINDVKETFSALEIEDYNCGRNNTDLISKDTTKAGYWVSRAGVVNKSSVWNCYTASVNAGDVVDITNACANGNVPAIVLLDSDDTVLSYLPTYSAGENLLLNESLSIPEGVEKIMVNAKPSVAACSISKQGNILYEHTEEYKEWKKLVDEVITQKGVDEANPFAKINQMPTFITMFRKIVCIGDSLTQGAFDAIDYEVEYRGNIRPEFSWVSQMQKMTGVECVNLGIASHSASRAAANPWIVTALDTSRDQSYPFAVTDFTENPGDAYIIALGTNDVSGLKSFTGDVSTDINDEDYTQNAETSVGGYAEIIQRIKEMQPKAYVFCVTIPNTRNSLATRTAANAKIKDIATRFGCYVIDLQTYAESEDDEFKQYYKNASHTNALGTNLRARQYIAYIDWIVEHNLDDFRNTQYIGSKMTWEPNQES